MAKPKSSMSNCTAGSAPTWVVWSAIAVVVVLTLVLAWLLIRRWVRPAAETFAEAKKAADKVVFMYMNGCGWCTKFEPTWDEFTSVAAPKLGVETEKLERSEEGAKEYMKHVEGFPTILFVNGTTGQVTVFDGERTIEGLTAFVKKESSQVPAKEAYGEPTEFGNIMNGVAASKTAADDHIAPMDKKVRDNAGGNVAATGK
jgi:hypothetical protein